RGRRRADLTTPHHARHVALHTHEAGATRRRGVAAHVWSWRPHGAVGTVVDRAAGARQNDQGNERQEGSHRESVSKTLVARRGQGQTLGQGSSANRSSFHPLCLLGESLPRDGSSREA